MTLTNYLEAHLRTSEAAFARQLGISPSFLNRIKNGSRLPKVDLAKKIEKATQRKVRAAVLMGLEKQR